MATPMRWRQVHSTCSIARAGRRHSSRLATAGGRRDGTPARGCRWRNGRHAGRRARAARCRRPRGGDRVRQRTGRPPATTDPALPCGRASQSDPGYSSLNRPGRAGGRLSCAWPSSRRHYMRQGNTDARGDQRRTRGLLQPPRGHPRRHRLPQGALPAHDPAPAAQAVPARAARPARTARAARHPRRRPAHGAAGRGARNAGRGCGNGTRRVGKTGSAGPDGMPDGTGRAGHASSCCNIRRPRALPPDGPTTHVFVADDLRQGRQVLWPARSQRRCRAAERARAQCHARRALAGTGPHGSATRRREKELLAQIASIGQHLRHRARRARHGPGRSKIGRWRVAALRDVRRPPRRCRLRVARADARAPATSSCR